MQEHAVLLTIVGVVALASVVLLLTDQPTTTGEVYGDVLRTTGRPSFAVPHICPVTCDTITRVADQSNYHQLIAVQGSCTVNPAVVGQVLDTWDTDVCTGTFRPTIEDPRGLAPQTQGAACTCSPVSSFKGKKSF